MWVSDERNSSDSLSFSNTDGEAELLRDDNGPESRLLPHLTSSADQEYLRRSERKLKAILVEINRALQQERPGWLEKEYPKRDISISTRRKTLADLVEGLTAAREHHNGEGMGLLAMKKKVLVQSQELISVFVPADCSSDVLEIAFAAIDGLFRVSIVFLIGF